MDPAPRCSQCGAALPTGGPHTFCIKCIGKLVLSSVPPWVQPEALTTPPSGLTALNRDPAFLTEGVPRRFGDYLLLEEIARGGMGIVYKARQLSLNRLVALKMILPGGRADEPAIRRFHTEAQAAAQLRHPHIVAVHEVGADQGRYFYSMDFIEGQNLAQKVQQYPLAARQASLCVKTLAEATHYAHEHQVLHRDLKPSNVLIDAQDQPHITDFGLAKLMHERSDATLSGVVMGSPCYMAPEQAQGQALAVGVRSDIYALGAILYELVTGRPPFKGESASATLKLVAESDPISPRQMNPKISRDLETICLKCLEKEPARRYASARALAEDLGRYIQGEPIQARRVGAMGKTVRWCRRKPALAAALAASALLLILGVAGITWQWRRAESGRRSAETERQMQRLRAYAADMRAADAAIQDNNVGQATQLLERYLPQAGVEDPRGLEWRYLWQLCRSDDAGGFQYPAPAHNVDLSPNGRWIITSGLDGWVRIHDMEGKEVVREPSGYDKGSLAMETVAFSPQGDLAAAANTTDILVWDTRQWQLQRRLPCDHASIAFSPNGQHLAAMGNLGLQVWSAKTWQLEVAPGECAMRPGDNNLVAFNRDNSLIALAHANAPGVALWSLAAKATVAQLPMIGAASLAISPNGRWLAAGSIFGQIKVWDLASQALAAELPPRTPYVMSLAFSPDSQVLAAGAADQQIHLWHAGTTNHLRQFQGHRSEIWWLRYSTDGRWLFSGSQDRTVRRWSTSAPATGLRSFQLPDDCLLLDLASQGQQAQVLNLPKHTFEEWDLTRTNLERQIRFHDAAADFQSAKIRPLHGFLYVACYLDNGCVKIYDTRTGQSVFPGPFQSNLILPSCISSDGRWLAGTEMTNGQWLGGVWSLPTGNRWLMLPDLVRDRFKTGNAAFSPDGSLLAYETVQHGINLRHLATARTRSLPGHSRPLYALSFSPNGRWLASASWDATARVWDAASGQPVTPWLVGHRSGVDWLHFSTDGRTLVTGCVYDHTIRFWHLPTGTEVLRSRFYPSGLDRIFASDDSVLMEGISTATSTFSWTPLPKLADIDAQIKTSALTRIGPRGP